MKLKKNWWKILAILLLLYTIMAGILGDVPRKPILNETIRNFYFHVPMWFGMIILFLVSVIYSLRYLSTQKEEHDLVAVEFANVGILFGVLGLVTGSLWAKFTWGDWWNNDPKQSGSAIALLIYFAYLVLRGSLPEDQVRAKVSSVYNIFAFATLIPLLFILPRMTDSLHPGSGGNPGFNKYDLDFGMRMVFYPAVIGWSLLGTWLAILNYRIGMLKKYYLDHD